MTNLSSTEPSVSFTMCSRSSSTSHGNEDFVSRNSDKSD